MFLPKFCYHVYSSGPISGACSYHLTCLRIFRIIRGCRDFRVTALGWDPVERIAFIPASWRSVNWFNIWTLEETEAACWAPKPVFVRKGSSLHRPLMDLKKTSTAWRKNYYIFCGFLLLSSLDYVGVSFRVWASPPFFGEGGGGRSSRSPSFCMRGGGVAVRTVR
jgi:hypothetical protein